MQVRVQEGGLEQDERLFAVEEKFLWSDSSARRDSGVGLSNG